MGASGHENYYPLLSAVAAPPRREHGERTRADEVGQSQRLQSRSSHLRNNCRRRVKEKLGGCSNMTIWRLRRDVICRSQRSLETGTSLWKMTLIGQWSCLLAHDSHIETVHYPLPKPLPRAFDRAPLASRALCPWWVLVSSLCSRIAAYGWAPRGGRVHGR